MNCGDGARGVELARIAGAAQIVEHLLVHVAQAGTGLEVVEVDGRFQLLDHGQHLRAGFHVVVGVFKDLRMTLCWGSALASNSLSAGNSSLLTKVISSLPAI
jgi:hypothetical protein